MKKQILLTLFFLTISFTAFSQNFISVGQAKFPATNIWNFQIKNYQWAEKLQVQIAKNSNGGYLFLVLPVPDQTVFMDGDLTVFLKNGTNFTVPANELLDNEGGMDAGGMAESLYSLTPSQMQQLANSNITKIALTVRENGGTYEGPNVTGDYIATNDKIIYDYIEYINKKETYFYETAQEVSSL
ncbi:hypothetical protein K5I29_06710 [Flavobacterium agricola]|uniref:Uncharacterized protein n=1 Tax=Flavobacterium agricola TaxID=2870839 RepID=A0ABY6M5D0_9FLAO|nr:hypothetical protein [Flavobacterium agricola]UYW02558.1 hypothetical protein K5I29_06710 [Flavobacterium agricola]